jgi:hypothetical protein
MPRLESIFLHSENKGGYNIRSRLVGDDLFQKALFHPATVLGFVAFDGFRPSRDPASRSRCQPLNDEFFV